MFEVQEALEDQKQDFNLKVEAMHQSQAMVSLQTRQGSSTCSVSTIALSELLAVSGCAPQEDTFRRRENGLKKKDLDLQAMPWPTIAVAGLICLQ